MFDQTTPNFLRMLPVAVGRSSFGSVAMRYTVFPICGRRHVIAHTRCLLIIRRRRRSKVHSNLIFVLFVLHSVIFFITWELNTGVKNNYNNNNKHRVRRLVTALTGVSAGPGSGRSLHDCLVRACAH